MPYHAAGFRRISQHDREPVVQVPDADIIALFVFREPEIEDLYQKEGIIIRGKRISHRLFRDIEGIQTGNKLKPAEIFFLIKTEK